MCLWGKGFGLSVWMHVCSSGCVHVWSREYFKVSACTWLECGFICSRISDCLVVSMCLSMTQYT